MTVALVATGDRITSGPIDPDLEQAMAELAPVARRIRQLESIIRIPEAAYSSRAAMLTERGDLYDRFSTRAQKLAMPGERPGRTLLLLVEEADRLFHATQRRRRPTLSQVLAGMRAVAAAAERDASEAQVDLFAARHRDLAARARVDAGAGAIRYLEASCA